jgi:hypothetical protein
MVAKVTGGKNLEALAKKAKDGVTGYDVGYFPQAKYADGTPVASVALWQEFGTRDSAGKVVVPERSFMRSTDKEIQKDIRKLVVKFRNAKAGNINRKGVIKIALFHVGKIQEKITNIISPPNKPSTASRKGSSNPLIDTAMMRNSTTFQVF